MKELSLHILDIVQNSIKASATLIIVTFSDNIVSNSVKITIEDNGVGMDEDTLQNVLNPFYTTRTTRKVGLGLSLLNEAANRCNGFLNITSKIGIGTKVECMFEKNNIDTAPLGNISETIITIVNSMCTSCDLIYRHTVNDNMFEFSTIKIKEILQEVDINSPDVLKWIREYINEALFDLNSKATN
ncbi:ATP-binding protein [Sedimentibacter sp. zth1]|uniref:ATP-binding protein n=1 Tax=Sedimentibacter sp. zth1 TaxID=2816908 RepID=UPI001A91D2D2|nr:ATP-binding protein [Sedimentibacter sp. zth1]QSX06202.1 ATP-binding protein [Sedimentibacter sp. zth1]